MNGNLHLPLSDEFSTIVYSNVDSLGNKKHELLNLVNELKPDIIALTEVNAKNQQQVNLPDYTIAGYDLFMNSDSKRGVLLLAEKSLNAEAVEDQNCHLFEECVWCKYETCNQEKVLLGVVYRSPKSSEENKERLFKIRRPFKIIDKNLCNG